MSHTNESIKINNNDDESSVAAVSNNSLETSPNEENLEDLLKNLHKQIKTTKWLEVNSAEKFEQENPELIKAWNEAISNNKSS